MEKVKEEKHVGNIEKIVNLAETRGDLFLAQTESKGLRNNEEFNKKFILYEDALKFAKEIVLNDQENMEIYLKEREPYYKLTSLKFYNSKTLL